MGAAVTRERIVVRAAFGVVAAVAAAELAIGFFQAFRDRWWSELWLLPDHTGSIWRWLTVAFLGTGAALALYVATRSPRHRPFAAVAVILALLAADKPYELHRHLSALIVVALVLTLVAVVAVFLRRGLLDLAGVALAVVALLLVTATVMDIATPPGSDPSGRPFVPMRIESVIEETLETAAWGLFGVVLLGAALRARRLRDEQARADRATEVAERRQPHVRRAIVGEEVGQHGLTDALHGRLAEARAQPAADHDGLDVEQVHS